MVNDQSMSSSGFQSDEKTKAYWGPKNLKFHDGGPTNLISFLILKSTQKFLGSFLMLIVYESQNIVSVGQNKYAEIFHIQC